MNELPLDRSTVKEGSLGGESLRTGLISLPESERENLSDALRELLAHGSIIGLEVGKLVLYQWCRQNFGGLKEAGRLLGLDIFLFHEERLVQALPQYGSLKLKLRQDETLVWLALWFAGDSRWRDEGEAQAFLSVSELNALLSDQLLPDAIGLYSKARMQQILRRAARYNLVRLSLAEPFEESGIEVLPSIRRVIPFRDLAEWTERVAQFQDNDADEAEYEDLEDEEEEA